MEQTYQPRSVIGVTGCAIGVGCAPAPKDPFGRPYMYVQTAGRQPEWQLAPMTASEARTIRADALKEAHIEVTALQAAVSTQLATAEEIEALKAWQVYLVDMNRVDPEHPLNIVWPEKPVGGL
ncbi:tail fiber assembly protein [Serratia fonticola]|uniref:tail fiber assembly protein n=1 Tax=Serratia fonticola TaxID=47917 RepID=UPI0013768A75|nr:tail fiber assembly protein [Serratia fonticola]NCG50172.1 tail assembly chaperone [Serratia fonticola]